MRVSINVNDNRHAPAGFDVTAMNEAGNATLYLTPIPFALSSSLAKVKN